jgi:hypothetical protein
MRRLRRYLIPTLFPLLALGCAAGCAARTAHLDTPEGRAAYYQLEAIDRIERLQTGAMSLNAQGQIADPVAIRIVQFTTTALRVVKETPFGWPATVETAYLEMKKALPPAVATQLAPWLGTIDALIASLTAP